MNNGWISVKDEWPLEILNVLWCSVPVDEPYTVASMCDEGFDENAYTHWMPLPAPPSESNEPSPVISNGLAMEEHPGMKS